MLNLRNKAQNHAAAGHDSGSINEPIIYDKKTSAHNSTGSLDEVEMLLEKVSLPGENAAYYISNAANIERLPGDEDDLDDEEDDEIDLDEELEIETDEVDVESIEIDDEDPDDLIEDDDDDLDDDDDIL